MKMYKTITTSVATLALATFANFTFAAGELIGIALPNKTEARWIMDGNNIVKNLKAFETGMDDLEKHQKDLASASNALETKANKAEADNDKEDTYLQSIASTEGNNNTAELLNYNINDEETIIKLAPEPTGGKGQNDYSKSSLQKILNNYYFKN